MSLLTRRTKDVLPGMRSNLMDLFDMDSFFSTPSRYSRVPAANIRETNDEFLVEIAAPGMTKKDFHVDVDNNILEINVEKEEQTEEQNKSYTRREFDYTSFYRSFDLPRTVQADDIKAEYESGILRVHLPKVPEAKGKPVKTIEIS
ncbi:Hsp20/alpha crystallin family protein [Fulvivirga sp. 29W222]|uniref:Hsp20/alpha crystallin family protein n=1 Tax=Fulvivirga marina TaxID=2494733 RepID=A0A937KD56_9BACT|nr:Hsp20/alpha crystallin family protein [Fulvivirga marina]MBL6448114.1 Hsp20/alpha crystallin family protein [Fulvivirga marina]